MLYKFTETKSQSVIAINPRHVVAVFETMEEGEFKGKTILNLINLLIIISSLIFLIHW